MATRITKKTTPPSQCASSHCCDRMTVMTLVIAIASLLLSGYAIYRSYQSTLDDREFSAKVERGINDFIAQKNAEAAGNSAAPSKPVQVSLGNAATKGNLKAPVTLVEFSDFQCPYCARFAQETMPRIISEYVDTGKVKLAFRHFPLSSHPNAKPAAIATECAREQGGSSIFYKFHDKIFANQASLNPDNLKKWAVELKLNATQFNGCLDTKKFEKQVEADLNEGLSYGVSGTPASFVNGRLISGAQPFAAFKTVIDEELQKAGK